MMIDDIVIPLLERNRTPMSNEELASMYSTLLAQAEEQSSSLDLDGASTAAAQIARDSGPQESAADEVDVASEEVAPEENEEAAEEAEEAPVEAAPE